MFRWLLSLCVLTYDASASPLQNITLPLPAGTTNHGTPGLLCTPTKWTDIALFFLLNYVAHAATVLTRPGERSIDYVVSVVGSLLLPVLGLYRGIEAIFGGAVFVKRDDLRKAARSGALCMVVRGDDWQPAHGEKVGNAVLRRPTPETEKTANPERGEVAMAGEDVKAGTWDSSTTLADMPSLHVIVYSAPWINSKFGCPIYVSRQIIHGTYSLPKGYRLAIVPSDARFDAPATPNSVIEVSATYNLVKALIALVQSVYALWTLYRSQGDQVEQFGYAAFGLSVAPYAVMSVVNLIGNLCRPDYPSLYMMESSAMDEARQRGGAFDGAVGRVLDDNSVVSSSGLGQDIAAERLHFHADEHGAVTASFETTQLPACPETIKSSPTQEKSALSGTSLTRQSCSVRSLPEKLDYTGTKADLILFIPCCDPTQRSPATVTTDEVPLRRHIAKYSLVKSRARLFGNAQAWFVRFKPSPLTHHMRRWYLAKYIVTFVIALTPIAINGAISHFRGGTIPLKESGTWRTYAIQSLIVGVTSGICWVFDQEAKDASPSTESQYRPVVRAALYVVSGAVALGVFVTVGQMIARYGVCVWVD